MKLFWGVYFVLTSLYCLLAYLPYTYYALIKAPAYVWMTWFVDHQAPLYWMALLAFAISEWPRGKDRVYFASLGLLTLSGGYVTLHPFLAELQNDRGAYLCSLLTVAPLLLAGLLDLRYYPLPADGAHDDCSFVYSSGVLAAVIVALACAGGTETRKYAESHMIKLHLGDLELVAWSLISHIVVALAAVTILNLVRLAAKRTRRPAAFRLGFTVLLAFAGVWFALARALANWFSFQGGAAQVYAACLAAGVTFFSISIAAPWLRKASPVQGRVSLARRLLLAAIIVSLSALAIALPLAIRNSDWNDVLEATFTLGLWLAIGLCVYNLRPRWGRYSMATMAAVLLVSAAIYQGLRFSTIFWGKPLGSNEDEIAQSMENYAHENVSLQLANYVLGTAHTEPCGDLCRILREYTNIRDFKVQAEVKLVEPLLPAAGERPDIFIFVIDSLRPDYLGAYNPQVDFTPNLDAFASDSIVLHRAYTQYAGTSLSEPAIWAGAMLLHAHFMQPFAKVNSLEKLANAEGYQMVLSYDVYLNALLSPADDPIKLDTDKPLWNQFEVCSTLEQTEQALDSRKDKTRPILFYAQPMNVHQFARNDTPLMNSSNWRFRPGFNNRIAYEVHHVDGCMGRFMRYLKARDMYDSSIIILLSDHGDATGEYGRFSHASSLYPEIMRVPIIVHLPPEMRKMVVYDDSRVSTLTDITPSLYYLLGHRPIQHNPLFGRPLFAASKQELDSYGRDEYLLASDVVAAYGILADNGRFLYFTSDSPPKSFLFDLVADPKGEHNVVSDALKRRYNQLIIEQLQAEADFYGYKPQWGSFLGSASKESVSH